MFSGLPRFSWRHSVRYGAVVALALSVASCDKAQLLAPTNSTITVSAATRTLALGASTEVSATVIESAGTQVQDGTTVRFSASLGRVEPAEAQTHHGVATTTFFAGDTSGVAEVRATSGGAGGGTTTTGGTGGTSTASNAVQITVGAANTNTVAVSASPSTVPISGGTVTITGQALDANGNRLINVPITFTTTAGTLSSSVATTNASGEAIVTLTSDRAATVTAAAGGKTATVAITQAGANSVALALSPNPGTVGSPVTATITPTIGTNNTPPRVAINWGDGTADQDLGTVAAARTASHVYSSAGNYTVTATATTGSDTFTTSATEAVNVASGPTVTATPNPATVNATVTFTVTPPSGSSPQNVVIDFDDGSEISLGAITGATTVTHRFGGARSYNVRVTQTNSNGSTGTGVVVVTVT